MSTSVSYTPFTGGLDTINSPIVIKDGRIIAGENFEERFGVQGYHRIDGFERFDGHPQPHMAGYAIQNFEAGTVEIVVGDTVTGAAVSAEVLSVTVSSGTWAGGTAAGYLILTNVSGSFVDAEKIQVSASNRADAVGVTYTGTIGDPYYKTRILSAVTAARSKISAVPGSGAILGVDLYKGVVYAARNAADGLTAAIYKSSAAGWVLVKDGLIPSGTWRFIVANFTGSAKTLSLFGCDGKNSPFFFDGTTYTKITGIYATNATSASSLAIATGSKTFVLAEADRNYTAGQVVTAWYSASAANFMTGTVTSWTSGTKTLVVDVTATGGSGTLAAWNIGLSDFSDKPFDMIAHKDHLFLSYPFGQVQTSNIGDPLTYTTTAALFGMGDEVTDMKPLKGNVLAIYCRNSLYMLSGSSQIDWQMDKYSTVAGALKFTAAEVAGIGIHIDDSGVKSLQATQVFGNYESSTFSREVGDLIASITPYVIGAHGHKKHQQYRIYTSNGTVVVCTVTTPQATISPSDVSFSILKYGRTLSCASTGELTDGSEVHFFGTSDGYVMREGVGTSFDGLAMDSVLRLTFSHFKSPSNKKRFRKLVLELSSPEEVTVFFKQLFDYADGFYQSSGNQGALASGTGGAWDESTWDTFHWSQPLQTQSEVQIAGVGRNMSLLLWHSSATDAPFTLQGMLTHYSVLGLTR